MKSQADELFEIIVFGESPIMTTRRQAIKLLLFFCAGASVLGGKIGTGFKMAYAKTKRIILPKGTPMAELMHKNPAKLDTRHLTTTPMDEFVKQVEP